MSSIMPASQFNMSSIMPAWQFNMLFLIVFVLFVVFLTLYATRKSTNATTSTTQAPKLYNVIMIITSNPSINYSEGNITWTTTALNTIAYVVVFGATIYDVEITNSGEEFDATFKLTVEASITGNNDCSVSLAVIGENGMLAIAGDNSQLQQSFNGIQCILGNANLLLKNGSYKRVDQLQVGDKLAQEYSPHAHGSESLAITEIVKTVITDFNNNLLDSHLFSSDDGKLVITFWHKILFEGKYILPIHHPSFKEIFMDKEFTVYNFRLETPGVLVTESNYILESLS